MGASVCERTDVPILYFMGGEQLSKYAKRLTGEQVLEIYNHGSLMSAYETAEKFSIDYTTVKNIWWGKTHKKITGGERLKDYIGKIGNNKIELKCPICGCIFKISHYRIEHTYKTGITCSYSCSAKYKSISGLKWNKVSDKVMSLIKHDYESTNRLVHQIASDYNINRITVSKYAKKYKWKRQKRTPTSRELYRKEASSKIGRDLVKYEQVHHIDLDTNNNKHNNLHVFKNARDHTKSHFSLQIAAIHFLKKGMIIFNDDTGLYEVSSTLQSR